MKPCRADAGRIYSKLIVPGRSPNSPWRISYSVGCAVNADIVPSRMVSRMALTLAVLTWRSALVPCQPGGEYSDTLSSTRRRYAWVLYYQFSVRILPCHMQVLNHQIIQPIAPITNLERLSVTF